MAAKAATQPDAKQITATSEAKANSLKRKVISGSTTSTRATTTTTSTRGTLKSKNDMTHTSRAKASTSTVQSTDSEPPKKKKRAVWDVKGRLQDLEEYHNQTETRLQSSTEMISTLTSQLGQSQSTSMSHHLY